VILDEHNREEAIIFQTDAFYVSCRVQPTRGDAPLQRLQVAQGVQRGKNRSPALFETGRTNLTART
jgi:hypothetical protein